MIKYLLTTLGRAGWENIWLLTMALGRSVRHLPQIIRQTPYILCLFFTQTISNFLNFKEIKFAGLGFGCHSKCLFQQDPVIAFLYGYGAFEHFLNLILKIYLYLTGPDLHSSDCQ